MAQILFINACIRHHSRTLELAKHVLSMLTGDTEVVNLYDEQLSPLTLAEMETRDKAAKTKDFSEDVFTLARQFAAAETIVIAAPYWDLSFPAVVKTYMEKITVNGLSFAYGENGIPHGLCKAKRLVYVTTAGGPIVYNLGYEYISALAKCLLGINAVECVRAEGLDVYGADVQSIMDNAKKSFRV